MKRQIIINHRKILQYIYSIIIDICQYRPYKYIVRLGNENTKNAIVSYRLLNLDDIFEKKLVRPV